MSRLIGEKVAKYTTAWQAGFALTLYLMTQLIGLLGIHGIIDSTGAQTLIAMHLAFTGYLFTITKHYKKQDKIIDATPQEQYTIKRSIETLLEPFGMKADIRLVPQNGEVRTAEHVSREEFQELKGLIQKVIKDLV